MKLFILFSSDYNYNYKKGGTNILAITTLTCRIEKDIDTPTAQKTYSTIYVTTSI